MANTLKICAAFGLALAAGACASSNQTKDDGPDNHSLSLLAATVWVDPDGCKHWVIDDGLEGYMTPVINVDGTPDCV